MGLISLDNREPGCSLSQPKTIPYRLPKPSPIPLHPAPYTSTTLRVSLVLSCLHVQNKERAPLIQCRRAMSKRTLYPATFPSSLYKRYKTFCIHIKTTVMGSQTSSDIPHINKKHSPGSPVLSKPTALRFPLQASSIKTTQHRLLPAQLSKYHIRLRHHAALPTKPKPGRNHRPLRLPRARRSTDPQYPLGLAIPRDRHRRTGIQCTHCTATTHQPTVKATHLYLYLSY
ncbi:hypothetical protein BDV10DRAFT_87681 [Aspergillus recurvatus]